MRSFFVCAMTVSALLLPVGCWDSQYIALPDSTGPDTDADTDGDADADVDSDSDVDTESESGESPVCSGGVFEGEALINVPSDLNYFEGYTQISGALRILCPECENLDQLHCLEIVGHSVHIQGSHLENVDGLSSLHTIGSEPDFGPLIFDSNAYLENIIGLSSLERMGILLIVQNNPMLVSLEPLSDVVPGEEPVFVDVIDNNSLQNLGGLEWVSRAHEVTIKNNHSLFEIFALGGLEFVDEMLWISNNESLHSADIFESLQNLGPITVCHNDALVEVGELPEGASVEGPIQVFNNSQLAYCEICEMVENAGELEFGSCQGNFEDDCWDNFINCP